MIANTATKSRKKEGKARGNQRRLVEPPNPLLFEPHLRLIYIMISLEFLSHSLVIIQLKKVCFNELLFFEKYKNFIRKWQPFFT